MLTDYELELLDFMYDECDTPYRMTQYDERFNVNYRAIMNGIERKFREADITGLPYKCLGGDRYVNSLHERNEYHTRHNIFIHKIMRIIDQYNWNDQIEGVAFWKMLEHHSMRIIGDFANNSTQWTDGGIDFFALQNEGHGNYAHVGQVKKQATVSVAHMRDLLGTCYLVNQSSDFRERYDCFDGGAIPIHSVQGYFVTSGQFSVHAKFVKDCASDQTSIPIRLINGLELSNVICQDNEFYTQPHVDLEIITEMFRGIEP